MTEFIAYSDETEVHGRDDLFLMGGYVAEKNEWPWMEKAWQQRVLDGPPRLPYLHMRQIKDAIWRMKHGMAFNDAENRISEASRVMDSFGNMAAIISSVRRSEMEAVFNSSGRKKRHVQVGLNEPDYFCFIAYARTMLAQVHAKWPLATKVHFIISEKQGVSEQMKEFKESMSRVLRTDELRNLLGDLSVGDMKNVTPLQAADTLMWHIQRYHRCRETQINMDASDAMRLARLIHNGGLDGTVHRWKKPDLEGMADTWMNLGWHP